MIIGVWYYKNGDKYDGEWEDDIKNGKGNIELRIRCLLLFQWE